jgi:N-sulfoglucosamine sulfohydrolase
MSRKHAGLISVAFIAAFLATHPFANAADATSTQPNFIFYITDDVSPDDLGCYGGVAHTPHIDKMAEEGMLFTRSMLTISSCSPSRCSTITGRYPHNTGAPELHTSLPEGLFMFPQALKEAGYYTALSGKNHMGTAVNPAFDLISGGKGPGREADWVEILAERPQDRPFFCWFASTDAHRDWAISDEGHIHDPAEAQVPPFLYDGPITRRDLADYYHEVSRTDYYLGELRAELERQGITDNTYILYTSDNGRPFPRCKTRLYDSGIQSPMVVCGPTVQAGVKTDSLISSIDVAATILKLAGLPIDPRVQGVSFAPVLTDPSAVVRDVAFAEHNWHVFQAHERMVANGDWLYIRNAFPERLNMCVESAPVFPSGVEIWDAHEQGLLNESQINLFAVPRAAEELYSVGDDPYQLTNVAETHPGVVAQMRTLLDRWTEETGDTIPENPTPDREKPDRTSIPGFRRGEMPGDATEATKINGKGPVLLDD